MSRDKLQSLGNCYDTFGLATVSYICHYVSRVEKQIREICDKNISNENYEKLRNYLSKKKKLNQIVRKGLSASKEGHFCLTKGTCTIQKDT